MINREKLDNSIDMAFGGTLGSAVGASIGTVAVFLWDAPIVSALPAIGALMGGFIGFSIAVIRIKLNDREEKLKEVTNLSSTDRVSEGES